MTLTPLPQTEQHYYAIKPLAPHSFFSLSIKWESSAAEGSADVRPGPLFPWGWYQETQLGLKTTSLLLSHWALVSEPWATTGRALPASGVKGKFNWEKKTIIWENKTQGSPILNRGKKIFHFFPTCPSRPSSITLSTGAGGRPHHFPITSGPPSLGAPWKWAPFQGPFHHPSSRGDGSSRPGQVPACTFALLTAQAAVERLNPSFQNL